ncbi:MAG: outer membrane beta-barrel family protein [Arachidicoccus sp.]|nr:outer membrane beta-barrel family protein [Arachidicoccus sp.]
MKKTILIVLFIASFTIIRAQSSSIEGKVIDTTSASKLKNAVICILQAKDSLLLRFTRTDAEGNFSIKNIDTGKFILSVSYPYYADYVQSLNIINKDSSIQLGAINIIQTAHLLKDVLVSQNLGAIRIKGDTTEFVADSFKVQPNATVEDLLKKLPGIQVDNNGKITAQGQTVPKVLVDGEEFFGDDPTLVTKNLRADMVDKVQLFDKSSDQSAFTGIDDDNKTKTINIKLKENKKNGYFGKLSGGIGTDNYKETQDMFNYFKGKKKIAGYVTLSNTGKTGLGFQEEMKYGVSDYELSSMDDGNLTFSSSSTNDPLQALQSWDGNYDGNGIPNAKTGGLHFDNKWGDDKQDINLNYKIGSISEKGITETKTQKNLPTGILYDTSSNKFYKDIFRQKMDGIYNIQFDSSSSLKLTVGGSLGSSKSDSYTNETTTRSTPDSLVNTSNNSSVFNGNTKAFNTSILWRKKFKKKGRTFSALFNEYLKNNLDKGFINNRSDFYNDKNIVDSTNIVDQRKKNSTRSNSLTGKLTYTEPLSKYLSIIMNYGIDIENATSDVRSYNKGADEEYNILDSIYSNHYTYNQLTNSGGLSFSYVNPKVNFKFGTNIGNTHYEQINTFNAQSLNRNFVNWQPNASFRYKFSQQNNLRVSYYGKTDQPSVTQLQPVANNNDNLNIYIGNPNLKPSFDNSITVNYNNYKVLSDRYINFYGSYNFTSNPVVTNVTTNDSTGGSTYTYFNIGSPSSNYYGGFNYGRKLKKLDMNIGFNIGINGSRYANYINQQQNTTTSNSYTFGFRLSKYKEKKYDLSFRASINYNSNNSTLQSQIDNNSWSYLLHPDFDFFLPAKFQLHTDGDYNWQQKTQSFAARSQFIWNGWFGKKFFKKENLLLKFSANDILNQNNGFSRNAYTQSITSTIKRYYMFSIVWDFSKMNGGATDK